MVFYKTMIFKRLQCDNIGNEEQLRGTLFVGYIVFEGSVQSDDNEHRLRRRQRSLLLSGGRYGKKQTIHFQKSCRRSFGYVFPFRLLDFSGGKCFFSYLRGKKHYLISKLYCY